MIRMLQFSLALVPFLVSSSLSQDLSRLGTTQAKRLLRSGTTISLRARRPSVGDALDAIEKATPNRVEILGEFSRPDAQARAKALPGPLRRATFWDAVRKIEEATGAVFRESDGGTLTLTTDPFQLGNSEPGGEPVASGAFLIVPTVNTFFKHTELLVRPEPWLANSRVDSYGLKIHLEDGKVIDYEPRFGATASFMRGELKLTVELEDDVEARQAKRVEFEAKLQVPLAPQPMTTPPLAKLLPQVVEKDGIEVAPISIEKNAEGESVLRLAVKGSRLEKDSVKLVGSSSTLQPKGHFSGGSGIDEKQTASFRFDADLDERSLSRYKLAVDLPVFELRTFGTLEELAGETKRLGELEVTVKKIERRGNSLQVVLETVGASGDLDGSVIATPGGEIVETTSRLSSGREDRTDVHLTFNSRELGGQTDACKLRLNVPTRVVSVEIDKLDERIGKAFEPPNARIRVTSAERHVPEQGEPTFNLTLRIAKTIVDAEAIDVLDARGRDVSISGWSSSGTDEQLIVLMLDPAGVGPDPGSLRLKVPVPTKIIEHDLEVTLENIRLKP